MDRIILDIPVSFMVFINRLTYSENIFGGMGVDMMTYLFDILLRYAEHLGETSEQINYHDLIVELSDIVPAILEYDTLPIRRGGYDVPVNLHNMVLREILDRLLYDIFIMLVDNNMLGKNVMITKVLGKKIMLSAT